MSPALRASFAKFYKNMKINLDKIKHDIEKFLGSKPVIEQSEMSIFIRYADDSLFIKDLMSICDTISDRPRAAVVDLYEGEIRILKKNIKSKYLLQL